MALIRINIADSLVSESAAKKPAYKMAKSGKTPVLVINSAKKSELQAVVGHLKKAKAAAVAGINASIKSNTAATKARQLPRGDKRTKLMATRKTEKAKATAEIKTAKAELREANKVAKAHGLGGLNLPLSAADIKTGVGADKALKAIRATKLTEFGVTGKRGTFKPMFMKEAKFEEVGRVSTPSDRKVKPGAKKKEVTASEIEREKAKLFGKKATPKTTQYKTIGQKNDGARQSLQAQSKQWDKDTRMAKRMLKELNDGKAITAKAGWSGSVKNGKGVFTNKNGKKIVVKKSDMTKYGLTPDSFKRSLGEADIHDTDKD